MTDKIKIGENEYKLPFGLDTVPVGEEEYTCVSADWDGKDCKRIYANDIYLALNELATLRQEREDLVKRVEELTAEVGRLMEAEADRDIADGKFVTVTNAEELQAMFNNTTPEGDDGEK